MSHEDATSTFVNTPRMWFWPPEIIEGVLCELSIDPSCLTKAHTQQEHGVIMQRVADQRHYLVLSQLDEAGSFGTLPSDYANITPRDFAELSSAIQSEWPRTATNALVRLSSLATYIEDRDVATLRPYFTRVFRGDAAAAVPTTPDELVLTLRTLIEQRKLTLAGTTEAKDAPPAAAAMDASEDEAEVAADESYSLLTSPSSSSPSSLPSSSSTAGGTGGASPSCSETRTVTLTTGAPPAAVRALAMERGGDWVFLANSESIAHKKRDAFALGAAPSSSEASRGLNESSFDCNRMISKTLRSLTDAVNGLFSEAEILENFGQSFRLGYANRQLKDQLREARDQLSSARRGGVHAGVEAATKAISASLHE